MPDRNVIAPEIMASHFENIAALQSVLRGERDMYRVSAPKYGEHTAFTTVFIDAGNHEAVNEHTEMIAAVAGCLTGQVNIEMVPPNEVIEKMQRYVCWLTENQFFVW